MRPPPVREAAAAGYGPRRRYRPFEETDHDRGQNESGCDAVEEISVGVEGIQPRGSSPKPAAVRPSSAQERNQRKERGEGEGQAEPNRQIDSPADEAARELAGTERPEHERGVVVGVNRGAEREREASERNAAGSAFLLRRALPRDEGEAAEGQHQPIRPGFIGVLICRRAEQNDCARGGAKRRSAATGEKIHAQPRHRHPDDFGKAQGERAPSESRKAGAGNGVEERRQLLGAGKEHGPHVAKSRAGRDVPRE